jgi:hypothetical protein
MIQNTEKAIRTRKSIRTYSGIDIEPEKKQQIIAFMQANSVGIFGNKVDFYWIDGNADEFKDVKLGTYGIITGTKSFITGKVKDGEKNFEDFGYCMEKLILYCTELNIGTCWMGGTYKKTAFASAIGLQEDEFIPAITPVGYFGVKRGTIDKMFRRVAGSDYRKPFDELFFSETFSQSLSEKERSLYGYFLEMVRLAPSAANKQPWRIVLVGKVFHFYLKRTPNYNNKVLLSDLQRVDMGICISHFESALSEKNVKHRWISEDPGPETNELTEYIASCELF